MKYNAKILVTGKSTRLCWVEVEANSKEEAEKKIENEDYDNIEDSYEVDYCNESIDEILRLEPVHETN